jgi:hypothetical protein
MESFLAKVPGMVARNRWIVGLTLVGAAGLYVGLRHGDHASSAPAAAAPSRNVPVKQLPVEHAPVRVVPATTAEPAHVPLDLGKGDVSPAVAKWKEPGLPGTFREIVAPDDGVNEEEQLTYRIRRLRFQLADAATACYTGGDGKEQLMLAYDLVVSQHVLTVDNLQVLSSTWSDQSVQGCIVDSVKGLHASAPDVPDMRKEQRTSISQHDLYERSRSAG